MRSLPVSELQDNNFNVARFTELVCLSCVIPRSCYLDSYIGQFMTLWYLSYAKKDVDKGSGQTLWDSS